MLAIDLDALVDVNAQLTRIAARLDRTPDRARAQRRYLMWREAAYASSTLPITVPDGVLILTGDVPLVAVFALLRNSKQLHLRKRLRAGAKVLVLRRLAPVTFIGASASGAWLAKLADAKFIGVGPADDDWPPGTVLTTSIEDALRIGSHDEEATALTRDDA